jgi:hypothetical protein
MKKTTKLLVATLAIAAMWTGCKKDDETVPAPKPPSNQEEEVITTMKLTFVDSSNTSNIKYATFRDPDGDGGKLYDIFDTVRLESNKTWITTVLLLNETVSPADTISNEVLEEGFDHLFCYTPAGKSATVIKTDLDKNNLPIGLESKWRTTSTGLGTMLIELKHQPGSKNGTCAPGSTDIQVLFPVKIQDPISSM